MSYSLLHAVLSYISEYPARLQELTGLARSLNSHTHDHLRLLLDSLKSSDASSNTPLSLSYDTRSRNVAAETSRAAALASFEDLRKRLEQETDKGRRVDSSRPIKLEAVTPVVVEVQSSWAREVRLAFRHVTFSGLAADSLLPNSSGSPHYMALITSPSSA